jgi:UDP-N-acetylmuramate: L-alanyl-gamma-D-glutamyl-meso-diaminopimelate ligase
VLNNLEYDHADIYPDVASIRGSSISCCAPCRRRGGMIVNGDDAELAATLEMGCWTPRETFALERRATGARTSRRDRRRAPFDGAAFQARGGRGRWPLLGEHNVMNALAAIAAARHVGVAPARAARGAGNFAA